jgi:hypothetical protein
MKLKIAAALIALAASSHGALVKLTSFAETYNALDDYGVVLSNGNPVASGAGVASVIVFSSLNDTQVAALAAAQDYSTLFAPGNFLTIGSDNFTNFAGAGYGEVDGFFDIGVTGYVPTVTNVTLYAYFTSGSELGLFKTNSTLVADPAPPTPESSYILSLSDGAAVIGSFDTYVIPSYGPGGTTNVTGNAFKLVNPVPEPSAALLGALGAFGLLRRRRA